MFGKLTDKLQGLFSQMRGQKILTESNIADAVREIRLALLDADVGYSVVSQFVRGVKEKALGDSVMKSVSPSQQFTKLVHDELVALMGGEEEPLQLQNGLNVFMLCGLQGSGKTTTAAKIASLLGRTQKNKKVLLAACDLQRPAAIEQLIKLGESISVPVFSIDGEKNALVVAKKAHEKARLEGFDVLIVDTAGRLHIDDALMQELEEIKKFLNPQEVLFVANAGLGQDAVKTAASFNERIEITGTVLTMLDGSARAGAAISIREVTKKPLKFEGVGEKVGDLQVFNPRSMADRILGMGDVINLVKKAQENITEEESQELEKKLKKASFTYEDYLKQMSRVRKMGSLKGLLKMLPGFGQLGDVNLDDKEFGKMESMIQSMTPEERSERVELEHSRRKRIAQGSGVMIDEVNRMVKGFKRMKQLFKNMPDMKAQAKKMGGMPDLEQLKQQFKGKKWH